VYNEFQDKINESRNKDGRFGKLIRIIGNPKILLLAYLNIKGKPGNMTPGFCFCAKEIKPGFCFCAKEIKPETVDGINLNFFDNLSQNILRGTFDLSTARNVMIPKLNSTESPRQGGEGTMLLPSSPCRVPRQGNSAARGGEGTMLIPLGAGNLRDKIVQKAISMALTSIYEPLFLDCSHGFRPGRGVHTALKDIKTRNSSAFKWAIEGDIYKFYETVPHILIMKLLRKRIDCPATEKLIWKILKAGYMDPLTSTIINPSLGTPKNSLLSPLLSNIVLHELDEFITRELEPQYNYGKIRKRNPDYCKASYKIEALKKKILKFGGDVKLYQKIPSSFLSSLGHKVLYFSVRKIEGTVLRTVPGPLGGPVSPGNLVPSFPFRGTQPVRGARGLGIAAAHQRKFPYFDLQDSNFKRFAYIRYADDWIILLIGSKHDALEIKAAAAKFLESLGLQLSDKKTKITNLSRERAKFPSPLAPLTGGLGFYISNQESYGSFPRSLVTLTGNEGTQLAPLARGLGKSKRSSPTHVKHIGKNLKVRVCITPRLKLLVPFEDIMEKLKSANFIRRNHAGNWFPISKTSILMMPHWYILNFYNSKVRGLYNYYLPANNVSGFSYIFWLMRASCAITLAHKFKLGQRTVNAAISKFGKDLAYRVDDKVRKFWSPPNW
jgi:retron-type reverse transcriptase